MGGFHVGVVLGHRDVEVPGDRDQQQPLKHTVNCIQCMLAQDACMNRSHVEGDDDARKQHGEDREGGVLEVLWRSRQIVIQYSTVQ